MKILFAIAALMGATVATPVFAQQQAAVQNDHGSTYGTAEEAAAGLARGDAPYIAHMAYQGRALNLQPARAIPGDQDQMVVVQMDVRVAGRTQRRWVFVPTRDVRQLVTPVGGAGYIFVPCGNKIYTVRMRQVAQSPEPCLDCERPAQPQQARQQASVSYTTEASVTYAAPQRVSYQGAPVQFLLPGQSIGSGLFPQSVGVAVSNVNNTSTTNHFTLPGATANPPFNVGTHPANPGGNQFVIGTEPANPAGGGNLTPNFGDGNSSNGGGNLTPNFGDGNSSNGGGNLTPNFGDGNSSNGNNGQGLLFPIIRDNNSNINGNGGSFTLDTNNSNNSNGSNNGNLTPNFGVNNVDNNTFTLDTNNSNNSNGSNNGNGGNLNPIFPN